MSEVELAKARFFAVVDACGSDSMAEEGAILSVGHEFLPACAIVVLNGGKATADYWEFLTEQTELAQREHDAQYNIGHEWGEAERHEQHEAVVARNQ
jgi:hypothetical protein